MVMKKGLEGPDAKASTVRGGKNQTLEEFGRDLTKAGSAPQVFVPSAHLRPWFSVSRHVAHEIHDPSMITASVKQTCLYHGACVLLDAWRFRSGLVLPGLSFLLRL